MTAAGAARAASASAAQKGIAAAAEPSRSPRGTGKGFESFEELQKLSWQELAQLVEDGKRTKDWVEFCAQAETRPDTRHFPSVYLAGFLAGEAKPPAHLLLNDLDVIDKEELVRRVKMAVKAGAGPLIGKGKDPERYSDDELRSHLRSNRVVLTTIKADSVGNGAASTVKGGKWVEAGKGVQKGTGMESAEAIGAGEKRPRPVKEAVDFSRLGVGGSLRLLGGPPVSEQEEARGEEADEQEEPEEDAQARAAPSEEAPEGAAAEVEEEEEEEDEPAHAEESEFGMLPHEGGGAEQERPPEASGRNAALEADYARVFGEQPLDEGDDGAGGSEEALDEEVCDDAGEDEAAEEALALGLAEALVGQADDAELDAAE